MSILSGSMLICWYASGMLQDLVYMRERTYKQFYCLDSVMSETLLFVGNNWDRINNKEIIHDKSEYRAYAQLDKQYRVAALIKRVGVTTVLVRVILSENQKQLSCVQCVVEKRDEYVVHGFTFGSFG